MGTIIRNASGITITGSITNITEKITSKHVVHKLPGANSDIVQKLGVSNRYFTLSGFSTGSTDITFLAALPNTTGSISFTSNISYFGSTIASVHVLFYDVSFSDVGGKPMERKYSIDMVEIK